MVDSLLDCKSVVISLTSRPVLRSVEPIGKWFESYWRGSDKNQTYNAIGDPYRVPSEESSAESTSLCIEDEISEDYLASLDPREWKSQDHYSILGLKSLRFRASEEQIKRCYKQTVLKYHPDKSTREVGRNNIEITEAIFTCITKAYEILGHSQKRKAYDSIDPTFDDSIPPPCVNSKENFFKSFTPCFESNARFSIIQPVPSLGDENTSFKDVETFYNFWYNFESWREFSYQDEEDLSKAENREERRWMEKQNKVARQKKKKEDSGRIRQLVDNAYSCDPRIKKFKEEQKERKAALKKAKIEAARALQEENERIRQMKLDEERKRNEILQKEEKEKADKIKREREELKKMLKKERKTLRTICKRHNYFANSDEERLKGMEEVESLCNNLTLDQLKSLNSDMSAGNAQTIGVIFRNHIEEVLKKLREIQLRDELPVSQDQTTKGENSNNRCSRSWNDEEEQLLVKAVKVFPPGTVDRWDCIASFLKVHGSDHINRTSKEVIAKVKAMQNEGFETRKQKANEDAFSSFSKSQFKDVDANNDSSSVSHEKNNVEEPWTANEQKLLEKALKTYPSSVPERWDRIAAAIPGRTKKECLKRYKELAALVKAKRAVASAIHSKD